MPTYESCIDLTPRNIAPTRSPSILPLFPFRSFSSARRILFGLDPQITCIYAIANHGHTMIYAASLGCFQSTDNCNKSRESIQTYWRSLVSIYVVSPAQRYTAVKLNFHGNSFLVASSRHPREDPRDSRGCRA